jgi:dihydropteroate synthase
MPKYTPFTPSNIIKLKGNSIIFSTDNAIVMGILNITDDSFYDGGKYVNEGDIIAQTTKMLDEGASIIDVGAQSSRPGATQISSEQELKKLLPIIKLLKNSFPEIVISVDSFWANTAKEAVIAGADIINDISAGEMDKQMFDTIAILQVPYIMMHMPGTPLNMQKNPVYKNVTQEVITFFEKKIEILKNKGVSQIVIDPGFGFGKTIKHNYELLNNLQEFKLLGFPVLIGASRKSMIYNLLDSSPQEALNGTSVINSMALQNGADILRVHDVKEAIECIKISTFAKNNC